ncbi:MAG: CopD family protein [Rhizobiales bacterium]|nr:CopD family protein [Hyphomicrobiales bacterium]
MFLWLKAGHVIAVIAWMAGLFYLPRFFVYHALAEAGGEVSEQFKVMERRLLRIIMTPAGVAAWLFGGLTMWLGGYFSEIPSWLVAKLWLVVVLTLLHIRLALHCRDFTADRRPYSVRYFRVLNEIPTAIVFAVVVLAVVKPF